jgi:two-component system NtrC family sensor kinase
MRRPTLDILAEGERESANPRAPALRTQLLLGLTLILVVLAASSGIYSFWSARRQLAETRLIQARTLGRAVAALLGGAGAVADGGDDPEALRRLVGTLMSGPDWARLEVYERNGQLLARAGQTACASAPKTYVGRAMRTQQQLLRPVAASGGIEVVTPVYRPNGLRAVAAARLCLPLPEGRARPLLRLWILMAVDSLALLLFVGVVVTRYVTRPLQRMRRAAARVARGDFAVQLDEQGSAELSSLATSFNRMTLALQVQLGQLEQQQRSLVQSEKLASVGRLAAGIAHEVGNPLQSIIGFTDVLLEQRIDEAEREDFLRRIQRESARIHQILRELLDYCRPTEQQSESVSLSAVVADALSLLQHTPRFRAVDVDVDLDAASRVMAVPGRLVQVLVNLLLNAADAMAGSGRVRIWAEPTASAIALHVANSGPPIPAQARDRIFDPFYTTKAVGEGTGLGLAVAQSIVESFGGQLSLDPDADDTTFVLTLPSA